jgi:hypothetical protein
MENLKLNVLTKDQITVYLKESCYVKYESEIIYEIVGDLNNNDFTKLEWFQQFGDSLRAITLNVYAYRKQLEFGFTEISFNQYGWFTKPEFLDQEKLIFGNPEHYMQHSTLCLARGINNVWTNSICYTFGCAGGSSPLSVYGEQFNSRKDALAAGLNKLKLLMTAKLNNTDTTNYKQPVITATLKDITAAQVNMVQLCLF